MWGDHECMGLLCATHNVDEVRHPESMRKSARVPDRRLVRGTSRAPKSADYWLGVEAESRPPATFPEVVPFGEPGELPQSVVALQADLSVHACTRPWSEWLLPYPAPVAARLHGGNEPAPKFPLRTLGPHVGAVRETFGSADAFSWRGESSEMGRAPFGGEYCAAWRALFESFAPLERAPAPARRHLLRARHAVAMGHGGPSRAEEVGSVVGGLDPS